MPSTSYLLTSDDVITAAEAIIADACLPYGDDERPHLKDLPEHDRQDTIHQAYVVLSAVTKVPPFSEILEYFDALPE